MPTTKPIDTPIEQPEYPTVRKPLSRVRVITRTPGESRTDTSQGNDTDVNKIVARFARTGVLPEGPSIDPYYADVTALQGDLTEIIQKGEDAKAELKKLEAEAKQKNEDDLQNKLNRLEELEKQQAEQTPEPTQPVE